MPRTTPKVLGQTRVPFSEEQIRPRRARRVSGGPGREGALTLLSGVPPSPWGLGSSKALQCQRPERLASR